MRANIRKSLWDGEGAGGGGLSLHVSGSQGFVDNRLNGGNENSRFLPAFSQTKVAALHGALQRAVHAPVQGRKFMRPSFFILGLAGLLALAGCGQTPGTRAVTGGLMGAGAGAGVSALTGGKPATGALIGGGIGAVGGAVTH
jgi:hypothetical protein